MSQVTRYTDPMSGRGTYCEPGGRVASLTESLEERVLEVAGKDFEQARELLKRNEASRDELIRALAYLAQSTKVILDVAKSRGERLDELQVHEEEASAG